MKAVAAVFAADLALGRLRPHLAREALLDETAHVLTTALLLLPFVSPRFRAGALAGSVAIDADHLPRVLGWRGLTRRVGRPYGHAPIVLAALTGAVGFAPRRARPVLLGAAAGTAVHLWRDLATGPGIPALWPLTKRSARIPYAVYAGSLVAAALSPWRRPT